MLELPSSRAILATARPSCYVLQQIVIVFFRMDQNMMRPSTCGTATTATHEHCTSDKTFSWAVVGTRSYGYVVVIHVVTVRYNVYIRASERNFSAAVGVWGVAYAIQTSTSAPSEHLFNMK